MAKTREQIVEDLIDHAKMKKLREEYSAEDEYDCMVCGVVSEKEMTQDDELCDSCLKTHGRCGVCQDIELLTDLHYDSTGMMNLCGRCEKHDETFGIDAQD
jgi:hypothetical protein|tara:strand:+ start:136 stop:438 length:303 start_codon:yes stop_codon:yes gene_type:complete